MLRCAWNLGSTRSSRSGRYSPATSRCTPITIQVSHRRALKKVCAFTFSQNTHEPDHCESVRMTKLGIRLIWNDATSAETMTFDSPIVSPHMARPILFRAMSLASLVLSNWMPARPAGNWTQRISATARAFDIDAEWDAPSQKSLSNAFVFLAIVRTKLLHQKPPNFLTWYKTDLTCLL